MPTEKTKKSIIKRDIFMARNLDAKCRKCRRSGEKLFLKGDRCFSPKCGFIRKAYAPGMHGKKKTRGGQSEFGHQLAVKQIGIAHV